MEPPSRYSIIYLVTQQTSEGRNRLWAHATQSRQQSLYCTVGGYPLTTVMTLKTFLQLGSLYHYSKKSSPIKRAESIDLILKSKFQVLSVINQFKNGRFI